MMTNDQVDDGFQALHDSLHQAQLMAMDLRDAGDNAGAARATARAEQLQSEIDSLLGKELSNWQAGAEQLIPELTTLATAAQAAVSAVESDVKNAQKIVAAMKALDAVVAAAVKFVA
jgi:hypothetical protein